MSPSKVRVLVSPTGPYLLFALPSLCLSVPFKALPFKALPFKALPGARADPAGEHPAGEHPAGEDPAGLELAEVPPPQVPPPPDPSPGPSPVSLEAADLRDGKVLLSASAGAATVSALPLSRRISSRGERPLVLVDCFEGLADSVLLLPEPRACEEGELREAVREALAKRLLIG
ncbi:hypothetical protein TeGR_g8974, partial [Tetraparma gracilis]